MGAAPSRESTTLYSYFRGTYEIGLIPLTKAFFGLPGDPHSRTTNKTEEGEEEEDVGIGLRYKQEPHVSQTTSTAAHLSSTMELRRQFVIMRSDPAILYANARGKVSASWPELLSDAFTEEDLDAFLDKVEERIYNTDAEMFANTKNALIPLPCALCLVCKDGQERSGSFFWRGRSIVVIGYFACLPEDLRSAFKVAKGKLPEGKKGTTGTDNDAKHTLSSTSQVSLFLNAGVLASAGDRTLERVLLLAAVMLRNQYLDSFFHVFAPTPIPSSYTGDVFQNIFNTEFDASPFFPHDGMFLDTAARGKNATAQQTREEALKTLERRLQNITVYVETAVDNYSSLKSLTENAAFLQCQTNLRPGLCFMDLPQVVLDGFEPAGITEENTEKTADGEQEEAKLHSARASLDDTTTAVENTKQDGETSKVGIHEETLEKAKFPETDEKASTKNSASVELVRVCFTPEYVVKATMWASGLLSSPTELVGGSWVQYKLKDESDELRQTLHGKDSIVANWREICKDVAGSYMGEGTLSLLRHVKALRDEVERARAISLNSWSVDKLIQTREGRTCALHHTSFGTMLVGIRSRRDGENIRGLDKKKQSIREKAGQGSDNDTSNYAAASRNSRNRAGSHSHASSQFQGLGHGSTSGGMHLDTLSNMSPMLNARSMGGVPTGPIYGAAPGGFVAPLPFVPEMQMPSNVAFQGNMMLAPMMVPFMGNGMRDASVMERKEQQGAVATPPLFHTVPFSTAPIDARGENLSGVYSNSNNPNRGDGKVVNPCASASQNFSAGDANITVPSYPFSVCNLSGTAPAGTAFPSSVNMPSQQQQQQFVLLQQGPGGVPVIVPVTSAVQQSSLPPPYGFSYGVSSGAPQVVVASQQPLVRDSSLSLPQTNTAAAAGAAASSGGGLVPNYVYYIPAPMGGGGQHAMGLC
ncbi:hypothetical protein, conserved [Trypanosoma cruzi]|uniref:Uncharacterized protein n=1 Tax=Trypanosoma cruzi (strain CL Brener) TaxID=353153 RepID=Q4CMX1_TRYCC|nr:hypothetical protein, conserved [Trypanosoma cruzi]EAN81623.1 hypothetical protein, conserved [Trypanosoma cruzi]|eukprot:XP_803069.1 hypothetical protein [Trypanosoma cruzi strain CL Brener]